MFRTFQHLLFRFIPSELRLRDNSVFEASKLYVYGLCAGGPVCFFYGLNFAAHGFWSLALTSWLSCAALLISYLVFYWKKSLYLGANVLALTSYTVIVVNCYYSGGIYSPGALWFGCVQVVLTLLFKGKTGLFWAFVFAITAFPLTYPEWFSLHHLNLLPPEMLKSHYLMGVLIPSFLIVMVSETYKSYSEKLRESEIDKNLKLAELNQYNSRLLQVLSHDVANSLGVIQYGTKLLRTTPEKFDQYADMIDRATKNVINIVGHLREQQSIISGKKKAKLFKVDLKRKCDKAIWLLDESIAVKKIQISFEEKTSNFTAWADPISCLNGVLCNLLSNAVKFSNVGAKINICLERTEDWVILSIIDHGIGISPEALADLFSFQKETTTLGTSGEQGSGFGMPLAKAYLESYGGQIYVLSKSQEYYPSEHGTIFVLKFKAA